jgi:hypothetical protein
MASDAHPFPDQDDFDRLMDESEQVAPAAVAFDTRPATTPPLSIPHLKRRLRDQLRELYPVRDALDGLQGKPSAKVPNLACAVIASVAAGLRFPVPDQEHPTYQKALALASARRLDHYGEDAFEEVSALIDIIEKALKGLHLLDQFDQRLPESWSNLPPSQLARSINGYTLTIFANAVVKV